MNNRVLIIDINKKEYTFENFDNKKKGLYLAYYLYTEICSKEDVVIARGALSGLLPGICSSYAVYYNPLISSINYATFNGISGATLFSDNIEAIVIKGQSQSNEILYIDIYDNKVLFNRCDELKLYDYLMMKNVVNSISNKIGESIFFNGNSLTENIFSSLSSSADNIINGNYLGSIFKNKGIKVLKLNPGNNSINIDLKKEFFNIGRLMQSEGTENLSSDRTCFGCNRHCFSCVSNTGKQNMKYIHYKRLNSIVTNIFSEEFLEDKEKLFFMFKVFSIDFMSVIPFLKFITSNNTLMTEIGISDKDRFEFRDIVIFLKNLNIDNNSFYKLLRTDIDLFSKEFDFDIERQGLFYNVVTLNKKEKEIIKKDFYPSYLFDIDFEDSDNYLIRKSIFEYFGICPNNNDIFDDYWVSRVGEKIDSKFSNIGRLNKYSEILFRYKHEVEKEFTGVNRLSGGNHV